MHWLTLTFLAWSGWGLTDIFLKLSDARRPFRNALRISALMGLAGLLLFSVSGGFSRAGLPELLRENIIYIAISAVSAVCILVSNIGLRFLDMSVMSPIENSSGVIPPLVLGGFYLMHGDWHKVADLHPAVYAGTALILTGMVLLGYAESRAERGADNGRTLRVGALAVLLPLAFCIADAVDTVVCGIVLDRDLSEDIGVGDLCIIYGLVNAVFGAVCWAALSALERRIYHPFRGGEGWPLLGAFSECGSYAAFLFAMELEPLLVPQIISSYCILSIVLSHWLLRERLTRLQYISLPPVIAGIALLAVYGD